MSRTEPSAKAVKKSFYQSRKYFVVYSNTLQVAVKLVI